MNRIILLFTVALLGATTGHAQSKSSKMIRINHVALYVSNLASSTAFYQDIVGLDTIPEPFHDGRHTWFSIGDKAHLHLIAGRKQAPEAEKNAHLCFSTSQLDKIIEKLTAQKIAYEDWAGHPSGVTRRVDGIRQIYFRDPDGYWIEVNDDFQ
ncbi:MAG: VOC family protein [Bacteroidetes bacterium]|nr:VOC family protein [Bacteroidota bacterium]